MKAELIREALTHVIFWNKIMDATCTCLDCRTQQNIEAELAELERLAEIGRATEKLFKAYAWVETIGEDFKSVEELLNWAKED
jgi:hypothetical protein